MNSIAASSSANLRDPAEFKKAERHTRRVWFCKIMLPLAAFSLLAVFVGSAFLSFTPTVGIELDKVGINDGNLVMQNPKMSGVDKNNRPYSMIANAAVQKLGEPDLIKLQKITAKLPMDEKSSALVTADKGNYDSKNETMRLTKNVEIKGARGMDISMEEADIDMKTGGLVSNTPVTVKSADTVISSDSLIVENNGETIIFKDRVKMIIKKPISRGVASPSPSQ